MKTIFDYNPTKEELKFLSAGLSKEEYELLFNDTAKALDLLYMLYDRGDEEYKKYYNLVPLTERYDFNRMILHT